MAGDWVRDDQLAHETVMIRRGPRSALMLVVAVHSTVLGPAIGGCRLWHYGHWSDAVEDALRLAEGMTLKNAAAGLSAGGGKAVIAAPAETLTAAMRRDAFLDLGDLVDSLGGDYTTAEDVGTTAQDMITVASRTRHVTGLPIDDGGHGDPAPYTARGVMACMEAMCDRIGLDSLAEATVAIAGLGQVGSALGRMLTETGAALYVSDIDECRMQTAADLGATWVAPEEIATVRCDIFTPAGVGGMLTESVIAQLDCRAVVGPANNQLAEPRGAELLRRRGIRYAPDFVVNAGGVIYLASGDDPAERRAAAERIDILGERLGEILDYADQEGIDSHRAAVRLADDRLTRARRGASDHFPAFVFHPALDYGLSHPRGDDAPVGGGQVRDAGPVRSGAVVEQQ